MWEGQPPKTPKTRNQRRGWRWIRSRNECASLPQRSPGLSECSVVLHLRIQAQPIQPPPCLCGATGGPEVGALGEVPFPADTADTAIPLSDRLILSDDLHLGLEFDPSLSQGDCLDLGDEVEHILRRSPTFVDDEIPMDLADSG